jgi:FtsZ-binding cell division protein ZapB
MQITAGVQTDAPPDYEELAAMRDEVVQMEQELLSVKDIMQVKMIALDEREHLLGERERAAQTKEQDLASGKDSLAAAQRQHRAEMQKGQKKGGEENAVNTIRVLRVELAEVTEKLNQTRKQLDAAEGRIEELGRELLGRAQENSKLAAELAAVKITKVGGFTEEGMSTPVRRAPVPVAVERSTGARVLQVASLSQALEEAQRW